MPITVVLGDGSRLVASHRHLDQTVPGHVVCSLRGALRPTVGIVTFLQKQLFHKMFHVETFRGPRRRVPFQGKTFNCQLGKSTDKTMTRVARLLLLGAALATSVTIYGWPFQNITPNSLEAGSITGSRVWRQLFR